MTQPIEKIHVGLDIAKDKIDVGILPTQAHFSVDNTPKGFQVLIQRLPKEVDMVVMEHTGKYGRAVLSALQAEQYPVCPVNPRQVRRFAQACGYLAKTDKLDAFVCAAFARKMPVQAAKPIGKDQQMLADLEVTRKQFVDDIVRYKNRLHGAEKPMQVMYRSVIRHFEKQLANVEATIERLVAKHAQWQRIVDVVSAVKGIGKTSAHMLVACLPELGRVSHEAIAALVGVAPYNCDSGYYRGKRRIAGGRKHVRDVMYMATLVATRHNPVIRDFYQRLLSKGKAKKLALIACQRKLLVILNAKVRDQLCEKPAELAS